MMRDVYFRYLPVNNSICPLLLELTATRPHVVDWVTLYANAKEHAMQQE
jgi:hypothetical protein